MQRIRVFERQWFSDEPELETMVNDHLKDFPEERVISMTLSSSRTGENDPITDQPGGWDTLVVLVEFPEA
jgi:hypothetical protein